MTPCFLIHLPSVEVVYVYPVNCDARFDDYARRFIGSYAANPPGFEHKMTVVLNNGKLRPEIQGGFKAIPNATFVERDNTGHDIGAYQFAAGRSSASLIVFLGASTYFQAKDWLGRMVEAALKHGPALYGVMGNTANVHVAGQRDVYPHIRTTGFWCHPQLMNEYPVRVTTNEQRYEFEHGETSFTRWVGQQGLDSWVVTWDGEYLLPHWDSIPNGFHRGDQSALLAGDHISEPPFYPYR